MNTKFDFKSLYFVKKKVIISNYAQKLKKQSHARCEKYILKIS